ncbi:hypothetical protein GCM10009678_66160 [Actinomadura kijaniata]|uniref:Uncharacterized protein n=1 Tax=Actinomadura namibiensis TaxID=182080 RepID=A0A7W3QRM3_ACTNM|nr:nucleotidyl transferase AbiEii/AbiGii toxin family protein [Actinomadura namibiensis]MBA8956518.1 hypothetical protein [Actinomadura namibiensis]
MGFSGEFETHVTVDGPADDLAGWAEARGLKFVHILLDRGRTPSQPMLTLRTGGTLADARADAERAAADLRAAGFTVTRLKIEASPRTEGVPVTDADALGPGFYFEHHIKLLLPGDADTAALAAVAARHSAHLSRNARRVRADGRQERFVTQRCREVGMQTAGRRMKALLNALRRHGGLEVGTVEREFVVFDDAPALDDGWIDEDGTVSAVRWGEYRPGPWPARPYLPDHAPEPEEAGWLGLPPTLRPVPGAMQSPVFDPALKQHPRAMRAGEPRFPSREQGERWYAARRRAVDHVLAAVEGSRWADDLVLRGSVLLRAWYGDLAREPGDLDFVVLSAMDDPGEMLTGLASDAGRLSRGDPVEIAAGEAAVSGIWTYDRVPGQRLVLPWRAEGLPSGTVQLDFVFGEPLPAEPELTEIPRADGGGPAVLNAATPELSLAWKLLWLLTDAYPQGKDLYDAWLLARNCRPSYRLLAEVTGHSEAPGPGALTLGRVAGIEADWQEFRKEYPGVRGEAEDYVRELANALAPVLPEGEP